MSRVAAIIQARLSSTRLPGKVLMEVLGRPLLSYQLERVRACRELDEIVLATTTNVADNRLVDFAKREGVAYFRGSEDDVLDRFYRCALAAGAEHVVRITADCPLFDPAVCELAVREYFAAGVEYLHTGPRFMEGLDCEIFSFKTLERAWSEAIRPYEREHCTQYIVNHPELFTAVSMENDRDDGMFRITVDEPADFAVVKALLEELSVSGRLLAGADELRTLLASRPDLLALNAHILRNEGLLVSLGGGEENTSAVRNPSQATSRGRGEMK